jgi:hypothetical protein
LNREKPISAVIADAIPDALTLTALAAMPRERLARLRLNIADALVRVDAVSALRGIAIEESE